MAISSFGVIRHALFHVILTAVFVAMIAPAADAGWRDRLAIPLLMRNGADLRVNSFQVDRTEVRPGDTVRATVKLSNLGPAQATSARLTFWIVVDGSTGYQVATANLGTVNPRAHLTYVGTFTVPDMPRAGTYHVLVNAETATRDRDDRNNTEVARIDVRAPVGADDIDTASGQESGEPATAVVVAGAKTTPSVSSENQNTPGTSGLSGEGAKSSSRPSPSPAPTSVANSGSTGSSSASGSVSSNNSQSAANGTPESSGAFESPAVESAACDYFASPSGRGDGRSVKSPFKIRDFWSVATPGTALCLLDGIYTGSDSMINPPAGLKGTSTNRITIRALNDGRVLIDGQFEHIPVYFDEDNDWFLLEGFNARNSRKALINVTTGSDNNVFRRLVVWDIVAHSNSSCINVTGGSRDNLFEDVGAFGMCRKVISSTQDGQNTTCRRCWARWEGSTAQGPKQTFSLAYNNYGFTCENCIALASGESMPETYDLIKPSDGTNLGARTNYEVDQPYGLLAMDRISDRTDRCTRARIFGSLAMLRSADLRIPWLGVVRFSKDADCVDLRHVVAVVDGGHNRRGFELQSFEGGSSASTAYNLTSIRPGSPGDSIGSTWSVRALSTGTSLARVASPWKATDAGANLCNRWVNGVRTNEPLWPWPMNDRIKAATAMAQRYAGPCINCIGGRNERRETDVTAEVEAVLGPIPAQCRAR